MTFWHDQINLLCGWNNTTWYPGFIGNLIEHKYKSNQHNKGVLASEISITIMAYATWSVVQVGENKNSLLIEKVIALLYLLFYFLLSLLEKPARAKNFSSFAVYFLVMWPTEYAQYCISRSPHRL